MSAMLAPRRRWCRQCRSGRSWPRRTREARTQHRQVLESTSHLSYSSSHASAPVLEARGGRSRCVLRFRPFTALLNALARPARQHPRPRSRSRGLAPPIDLVGAQLAPLALGAAHAAPHPQAQGRAAVLRGKVWRGDRCRADGVRQVDACVWAAGRGYYATADSADVVTVQSCRSTCTRRGGRQRAESLRAPSREGLRRRRSQRGSPRKSGPSWATRWVRAESTDAIPV